MIRIEDALIQGMVDDLVVRASDDWVMLVELDNVVRRIADMHLVDLGSDERFSAGLEVIGRAFDAGLMIPGDVLAPSGFVPWPVDHKTALERIGREWRQLGRDLEMGDVCWLANTEAGNAYADELSSKRDDRLNRE